MLPPMWRIEACMNIAVKTVCQHGSGFGGGDARLAVGQPLLLHSTVG